MKTKKRILSIAIFTLIFLLTGVISCEFPWSNYYLPENSKEKPKEEDPKPAGEIDIVTNDRPETGKSLTANYSENDLVLLQWFFTPIGSDEDFEPVPVSTSAGGTNALFYPSEPGEYYVVVTTSGGDSVESEIIVINGDKLPQLGSFVIINGSGKTGEPLTASYSGSEVGGSVVFYNWYRNGVPLPPPAPPATNDKIIPTTPGLYIASARVAGYNPKPSSPIAVSDTGGLPINVSVSPPNPVMGSTVTVNINPPISNPVYEWIDPVGASVGTNSTTSPVLDSVGDWKVRVSDPDGRVREYTFPVVSGSIADTLSGDAVIKGTGKINEPLTAEYTGNEDPVSFQWYKDGIRIHDPLGSSDEIPNPTEGTYVVRASVPGFNPKPSVPANVSAVGGLGLDINLDFDPVAGNTTSTTADAALVPSMPGITYEWFRPDGTPAGVGPTSPSLTLGEWMVIGTDPATGRVRERRFDVVLGTLAGTFRIDGSGKVGEPLTAFYFHSTSPRVQEGDPSYEWLRDGNPLSPTVISDTFSPALSGIYSIRVHVDEFYPRDSHEGTPVHVVTGYPGNEGNDSVIVDVREVNGRSVGGLRGDITFQQDIGFGNVTLPEGEPVSQGTPVTAAYIVAAGEPAVVSPTNPYTYQWFSPSNTTINHPTTHVPTGTGQTYTLNEVGWWTIKIVGPAPNNRTFERRIEVMGNATGTMIITGSGQTTTPSGTPPFAKSPTPLVATFNTGISGQQTFQWLKETPADSNIYTPIDGANTNSFTPTETGNHIVQVTIPSYAPFTSSPPINVLNTQLDRGGLAGTVVFAPAMPNNAAYNEYNRTTTVTFTPGIGAVPPFTYEWFRPGENTPTAGSGADNRTSPTLAQLGSAPGLGWWRLVITDANGRVRERPFNVTLPNLAGTISINGSGRTGEQLIASYSGSELGDRTFEWYRNGAPLVPPETAIVAPGTTATIPGNRVEAGDYTVRVNIYGYNTLTNSPVVYVKPEGGLPVTVTFDPVSPGVNGPVQAILTPNRNGSYQWQRETSPTPTGSGTYTNATGSGATSATYTPNSIGWHKVIFTEDVTGRVIEETVKVLGRLTGGTITITGTGKPGEPLEADYIHGDQDGDVTFTWEREGPPGTWTTVSEDNPFTPTLEGNYRVVVWVEEYAPWWGGGSGIGIDRRGGLAGSLGVADGLTGRTTEASWQTTVAGPFTIFWYRPDGTLAESSVITNNSANGSPVLDIHGGPPEEEGWRVVVEGPNDRSREAYFNVIRTNHDVQFMAPGAIEPGNFTQFLNVPYGTVLSRTSNPPTAPATDPTRRGYTFDQWCSDTGLMNVFTIGVNSIRPLSQVVQIHARWNFAPGSLTIGGPGDAGTLGSAGTVFRIVPMVSDGGFFIIGSTQRYHYLEVSNNDRGVTHQWDTSAAPVQITPETLTGIYAGSQNTNRIIAASSNNPAAASTRPNGGFSGREDWFLPSIEELRALYNELSSAQRATLNLTGTYWSSSEASATQAWTFNMDNGAETPQSKGEVFKVRPIRAF